jgi:hypothetical protein
MWKREWLGTISAERRGWCYAENEGRRAAYIASLSICGRSQVTNGEVVLLATNGMGEGIAKFRKAQRAS